MTMITPSYLGETIEYSSLHACRSTLEDPTTARVSRTRSFPVGKVVSAGQRPCRDGRLEGGARRAYYSYGMRKYVIMGVQGSGKGTQSEMLASDLDLVHIAVGDIFRWNVQNHTKLGAQVRRIMASGELVSDDLAEGVVKDRLIQHDWNYGFIIDGFPRNERQAEFFLESYDIDGVIYLMLPDSEVRRRVMARRLCDGCGMDYNLIDNSPRKEGQCDVCGGKLVQREDDTEDALAVRLREYHDKTNPVLDIFRRKEYVVTIDARPSKIEVQQAIRAALKLPQYWGCVACGAGRRLIRSRAASAPQAPLPRWHPAGCGCGQVMR